MELKQEKQRYIYADYCEWGNDTRYELIDGIAYIMASPSMKHQETLGNLYWKFREHLQGKNCKVFVAPFDVRLNWDKGDDTVVQPDVFVVCDRDKLSDGKSCKGAPDLVIEILSPSTATYDVMKKFTKYTDAGVKEIWFADPDTGEVRIYKKEDSKYFVNMFGPTDKITVGILPDLTIDMKEIFEIEEGENP
ncbi:MAG: Uma2 family endonuclease [Defluviitaleaceae bacterium]|nr:Uma2 family endonuclease [Defluviitaleaceae bacterium]